MLDVLKSSGVVGAGGAGFPTYAKLSQKAEHVILNAAECEPLLYVDQQLVEHFSSEILFGLNIARELVGAQKAIIGIKAKHEKLINILNGKITSMGYDGFVDISAMADVYPAGDEHVMVYELTGRIVPESGIPLNVGCVVINVETALNIHNAANGIPVTETFVTLSGDIRTPVTLKVPVGTPVLDILSISGLEDFTGYSVIDGGPAMGDVLDDLNGFVTKKSKGFIVLKSDSRLIRKKNVSFEQARKIGRSACEQCRMCTDLCPRYLLGHNLQPHKTMRLLAYNVTDVEEQKSTQLCCQCGLCDLFACPAELYPRIANEHYKAKLLKEGIRYQPVKTDFTPRAVRKYRMLPGKRLLYRLGLYQYDKVAPLSDIKLNPKMVRILTSQHIGKPATPNVGLNEQVSKGQLVGDVAGDSLGAAVHSSIDGTVTAVTKDYIEITGA